MQTLSVPPGNTAVRTVTILDFSLRLIRTDQEDITLQRFSKNHSCRRPQQLFQDRQVHVLCTKRHCEDHSENGENYDVKPKKEHPFLAQLSYFWSAVQFDYFRFKRQVMNQLYC